MNSATIGTIFSFLAAIVVASFIAGLGYLAARKAGLGNVQAEYVRALEGTNDAFRDRLEVIEAELAREKKARERLTHKVARLERTVVSLASENDKLRVRLKMPRRIAEVPDLADERDEEDEEDAS